jgi:hypothetical protein
VAAHRIWSLVLATALAASTVISPWAPLAGADDDSAQRDLGSASDFRVRVAAALVLGKSKGPGARQALERALGDVHPSVRTAAAAALGSLGDARALPALKTALATEANAGVKSQLDQTVKRLSSLPPPVKAKYLVALGKLENKSGVPAATLAPALKDTTRARMALVPGVEVLADGADAPAEGKSRNLPAFQIDGSITKLTKQQGSDGVGYSARVEFVLRRVPQQTLSGSMNGTAQALADAREVRGQSELAQLQLDALSAAVEIAFKGAPPAFEAGAR